MKQFLAKMGMAGVIAALSVVFVSSPVLSAEKKNISGSKNTKRIVSRNTAFPGDDPKHVINQTVREDTITSSDPDWNDLEATAYEQSDHAAGTGSHRGYLIIHHKNGEESYLKYEGTDKMVVKEGGAWEVFSEGKIQTTGGTGKFKDMKGSGSYKGKTTAKESTLNWEATMEY